MGDKATQRSFSEERHRRRAWATRVSHSRNPAMRMAWSFLSFKRGGVDRLARSADSARPVLDLGCGNGAYAYWFQGRRAATVVGLDWSRAALGDAQRVGRAKFLRVCADMRYQPFKEERFGAVLSVDALGHVRERGMVLDELARVAAPGARLFLHCECADPQDRWPDSSLIRKLGTDTVGAIDGHVGVPRSTVFRHECACRFRLDGFESPAGLLGWAIGYPEKYWKAFRASRAYFWMVVALILAGVKRLPVAGVLMRAINATTNHLELFLGLTGGGSCFVQLTRDDGRGEQDEA